MLTLQSMPILEKNPFLDKTPYQVRTMLALQPLLPQMPAFAKTPYLRERYYEQDEITEPSVNWNSIINDYQVSLSPSICEPLTSPFPNSLPFSNVSQLSSEGSDFNSVPEFNFDCVPDMPYPDFGDLISWDYPTTPVDGPSPSLEKNTTSDSLNYISPSVEDFTDEQDDTSEDSAHEDIIHSPLESSWNSENEYLHNHESSTYKFCEHLTAEEESGLITIAMGKSFGMVDFTSFSHSSHPDEPFTMQQKSEGVAISTSKLSCAIEPVSPVPSRERNRKRKSSPKSGSDDLSSYTDSKRTKVTQHNLIERRYRNKINERVESLRKTIPSLQETVGSDDASSPKDTVKVNKALILTKAIEYIADLEKRTKYLSKMNESLNNRIDAFERLIVALEKPASLKNTGKGVGTSRG